MSNRRLMALLMAETFNQSYDFPVGNITLEAADDFFAVYRVFFVFENAAEIKLFTSPER